MIGISIIFGGLYVFSAIFVLALVLSFLSGNMDLSAVGIGPTLFCVATFIIGTISLVYSEKERARKTKGRECNAACLEGLPDFEREQRIHLTLDVKNRVILMDGKKVKDVPSKHQQYTLTKHLKETQVRLRFQQITKLSYICWEGEVTRWEPGTSGFSYPGIFEGTRHYVPPTEGYFKTETLRVNHALEIRYQNQIGVPSRIVLDISKDTSYAEALLESLCRCTRLPVPQYIPPVPSPNPGPKYL